MAQLTMEAKAEAERANLVKITISLMEAKAAVERAKENFVAACEAFHEATGLFIHRPEGE